VDNFTSAVYLGFRHSSAELRPWRELTFGVPAALNEPAAAVAAGFARLVGCERAVLAPSTLHLFWDLLGTRAFRGRPIFVDAGTYPIARWGAERAASRGAPVTEFAHYDAAALQVELRRAQPRRAVVVCDGLCPACGRAAPIREYAAAAAQFDGTLLIDDTQALGILGERGVTGIPYGTGGGGVLRWSGTAEANVVWVASLAKGFGVPAAVLAANREVVMRFENESETRIHCSPVSAAAVNAAENALDLNDRIGDAARARLFQRVWRFKTRLEENGVRTAGNYFPVQSLRSRAGTSAASLHERLLSSGIQTVLHRNRHDGGSSVSFLMNAHHSVLEIDAAVDAVTAIPECEWNDSGVRYDRRVASGRRTV
jgi:8-amino-7-oxononanoate synthase